MKRREFLQKSAMLGAAAAIPATVLGRLSGGALTRGAGADDAAAIPDPLRAPAKGTIPVAFLISDDAVVIDFAGPWEVFNNVMLPSRGPTMDDQMPFRTYTVSESAAPIRASGGMQIVPDYTLAKAPAPKVIVIPAQEGAGKASLEWIRQASRATDVTMSVCTGAFVLAETGLLSGKAATTHHDSYSAFAMQYPDIRLRRGARFVEEGNLATSGGLSSGIDLALRVVERYFGRAAVQSTVYQLEYQGTGWMDPNSNQEYAQKRVSTAEHPLCPVCGMDVDPQNAPKSVYRGKTYYFCSQDHKQRFDQAPEKWL
ncbi:MAG TPA: DJ-1/PfpI family protein [Terriglobales bacterium]|nr:DJ-1/PfpI family protein [Terriglobales bacterium]